ncbi:MAG: hypothetical protein ACRDG9_13290, partial [Actinomycetota bacterium]
MDEIEDRIADAIESEDADVDIAKVEEAQEAFEDGDMVQTELLLEQAIGACPGQPVVTPEGIRTPLAITSPCPAPAHLEGARWQPRRGDRPARRARARGAGDPGRAVPREEGPWPRSV